MIISLKEALFSKKQKNKKTYNSCE